MFKGKLPRLMAVLGTAAAAASLVGVAAAGTGAYFTASAPGSITGDLATVAVTTSGGSGANHLDFTWDNMLPGFDKVASVHVQNTGTVSEDIYLAFKNDNGAWSGINSLGAYGIMTVNGVVFDNMSNKYAQGTDTSGQIISTDPNSGCYNVARPNKIAYLPHVIGLGTLAPTASKDFEIKFQFNACMTGNQGDAFGPLGFQIAAFQVGINPNDPYNGTGKIVPLDLSAYGAYSNQ